MRLILKKGVDEGEIGEIAAAVAARDVRSNSADCRNVVEQMPRGGPGDLETLSPRLREREREGVDVLSRSFI